MKNKLFFTLLIFYSFLSAQTKITILHTNNLNSTLENCICPDHPFGSIEKIKPLVDEIRKKEKNVLLLDAGDILSPFGDKHKDKTMLEALPYLKYDVITAGDQDFLNGMDFFKKSFIKNKFPLISSNLSIGVPPYVVKKFGKIRLGIIGITSPIAFNFFPEDRRGEITVDDADKNIEKALKALKGKADIIILLSHSGLDEDKKFAAKYPEINLIVGGHSQNVLKEGERVCNTLITQAGGDGYYLGRIDISVDTDRKISQISARLIPIGIELKNDAQIVSIIKKYDFSFIQKAVKSQKLVKPIAESYFVGESENCKKCHSKEYAAWQKSAHARSWQSLVNDKKTKSMKCVSCHVSGFGRQEGFINENITPEMKNVSCTDCHYTASTHFTNKNKKTVKKIDQATCIRCHDKENDAGFNYKEALLRIKH
jgi:2',3'-cyclic-nucleotide 2'-phosphodiesterase (5'-nucleotidase family)